MDKNKPITVAKHCAKDKKLPEPYDNAMLWRYINSCTDDALKTNKTFTRL